MKSEQVAPKSLKPEEKRLYIRPELKKFGKLKDMTAADSPDLAVSGCRIG